MTLAAGSRLGPYEILAPIGAGGMARSISRRTRLSRKVALKLLPEALKPDSDAQRRFLAGERTVSALNEPHIVTIYDVGADGTSDFIAIEYVEGAGSRRRAGSAARRAR